MCDMCQPSAKGDRGGRQERAKAGADADADAGPWMDGFLHAVLVGSGGSRSL